MRYRKCKDKFKGFKEVSKLFRMNRKSIKPLKQQQSVKNINPYVNNSANFKNKFNDNKSSYQPSKNV